MQLYHILRFCCDKVGEDLDLGLEDIDLDSGLELGLDLNLEDLDLDLDNGLESGHKDDKSGDEEAGDARDAGDDADNKARDDRDDEAVTRMMKPSQ